MTVFSGWVPFTEVLYHCANDAFGLDLPTNETEQIEAGFVEKANEAKQTKGKKRDGEKSLKHANSEQVGRWTASRTICSSEEYMVS